MKTFIRTIYLTILLSVIPTTLLGADSIEFKLPTGTPLSSEMLRILMLMTSLGIAPFLAMTVTSFTRIAIVLSILRNGIGLQQSPPNMVITALSIFLTFFVMEPVFIKSYNNGIKPLLENKISETDALVKIGTPFHEFMVSEVGSKEIKTLADIADIEVTEKPADIPYRVLIPAFMLSELRRAFEIGFLIFLPFLIIDITVASILMSMGMMMMPPTSISLPFKLVFFTLVDGWDALAGNLVKSFF